MTTRSDGSGPVRSSANRAASMKSAPADEDRGLRYLKRALRKAERRAGDGSDIGGTGATILKFLPAPLARLLDKGRIGTEEVRAADDIAVAFHAQAGALFVSHPRM
jgi:hypothetical protein